MRHLSEQYNTWHLRLDISKAILTEMAFSDSCIEAVEYGAKRCEAHDENGVSVPDNVITYGLMTVQFKPHRNLYVS